MLKSRDAGASEASRSYGIILRTSATMAGSFAIVMVLSFLRMKVTALLLGPAGVGQLGVLSSMLDLCVAVAGIGLQQSGVRQIAAARDDAARADVISALRWLSLGLGIAGAAILILASVPMSQLTFGSHHYSASIALMSVALLLRVLSGGQIAILQGMRQIGVLARVNIFAALLSTLVCIPLVYFWRDQAIAPLIITMAGATALIGWLLTRELVPRGPQDRSALGRESRGLLHLGLIFMASTLLTSGAAYLARVIIVQNSGMAGAGLYQAAWALGVLYSGFILQAMGSDFFPRLSALAHDNVACNRLVNEQIRVSILLTAPGVLGTITFAQVVIHLFYAAEFTAAAETLRWISLGTFLQTLSWPAGFVLLVKGAKRVFFWLEASTAALQVGLTLVLVPIHGPAGAGMAFCLMYLSHTLAVSVLARRASGFRWDSGNLGLALGYLALIAMVLVGFRSLDELAATILGAVATAAATGFSVMALARLVPVEAMPPFIRRFVGRLA